jgi:hypothetical protein
MSIQIPTITRADLIKPESWQEVTVELLTPSSGSTPLRRERAPAIAALLAFSLPPGRAHLAVIRHARSDRTLIVRGGQDFYLSDGSDLLGCSLDGGFFSWSKSYLSVPMSQGDTDRAIARFVAQVDDKSLADSELRVLRVDLRHAAPFSFFTAESAGGSQPGKPTIEGIELESRVLRLVLVSPGRRYQASFWIDLSTAKLLRSVVDGKETNLHLW